MNSSALSNLGISPSIATNLISTCISALNQLHIGYCQVKAIYSFGCEKITYIYLHNILCTEYTWNPLVCFAKLKNAQYS